MSVISDLSNKVELSSDTNAELLGRAPARRLEDASVSTEVVATAQDKQGFESLVGRIFLHREGDSTAKTWAVRVLAVLLLPFTILTALFDAGRFAAYSASLIDGKSYSLIDMTSNACQTVAGNVKSAYNSYMNPVVTIEQENQATSKQMQKLAKELVGAYDQLNARHFSDPSALKAARRIPQIQERLVTEIYAYVTRNATKAEEFAGRLLEAREMVSQKITEAAGDRVYIANKVERLGPPQSLARVINAEFNAAYESNRKVFFSTLTQIVTQGSEVIAGLKSGIQQGVISSEEAKDAVRNHAATVFNRDLKEGLETAREMNESFLKECVKQGLLSEADVRDTSNAGKADVSDLATAAAKDVALTLTETTSEEAIAQRLIKVSEKLKAESRLIAEDESRFLAEAKNQVHNVRGKTQEGREAQIQQEQEAGATLAVQEVEAVQKVELLNKLMGSFAGLLNMVSNKQKNLEDLHAKHASLKEALTNARGRFINLKNQKILVNRSEVSMLKAASMYSEEVARISGLQVTDAERRRQLEDLSAKGFDQNTVQIINELNSLTQNTILPIVASMTEVAKEIKVHHDEVKHLLSVYNVFKKNNIRLLEKVHKEAVAAQEKPIVSLQDSIDNKHNHLHQITYIQKWRGKPSVELDAEANRAEVTRLLEGSNKLEDSVKEDVIQTVDPAPNVFRQGFGEVLSLMGRKNQSNPFRFMNSLNRRF